MITVQVQKIRNAEKAELAELSYRLQTETNAVRRRPEITCPKKRQGEKMRAGNLGRNQSSSSKPFLRDFTK